jgi:hypothetical protein
LRFQQAAKDRIILPDTVRDAAPDVILASWCGKKVVPDKIRKRPGWHEIPTVRDNRIVEIKSALILQPGPAALTDGPTPSSRRCGLNQRNGAVILRCEILRASKNDDPLAPSEHAGWAKRSVPTMTLQRWARRKARLCPPYGLSTLSPRRTIPR